MKLNHPHCELPIEQSQCSTIYGEYPFARVPHQKIDFFRHIFKYQQSCTRHPYKHLF